MNKKLSVYYHPYAFWDRRISGVGRYVCDLTSAITKLDVQVHIPIRDTVTENLLFAPFYKEMAAETPEAPWYLKALCYFGKKSPKAALFYKFMRRWEGIESMKTNSYDLIHPTHTNALEILKYRKNTPLVVTVHDMIHELYPKSFSPTDPSSQRKKIMVDASDRVIAISQQTKEDLVRLFGTDPDKIDVIHHGNSLVLPENHDQIPVSTPSKFILYVGHRNGYKNFPNFVAAFAKLHQDYPDMHLICTGGGSFSLEEMACFEQYHLSSHVEQRWVTDDELAILYNRSALFAYPSCYEGFGLPLLEAFACGAPVACALASCFPEVAGDAAVYFDPLNVDEMYQAMASLCSDEYLASAYRQKGKQRLQSFSWEKSAQKTLCCYQQAIESHATRYN